MLKAAKPNHMIKAIALASALALSACSSSGSRDVLNAVGSVAGEIVGTNIGGPTGNLVRNLSKNTGDIASALDTSDEGDRVTAREYEAKIEQSGKVSRNIAMQNYLNEITLRLAAHAPAGKYNYRVRLLNGPVNAVTPGGGLIVVYDGLLEELENEAQVATVLAHEIGHIIKKHPKNTQRARVGAAVAGAVIGTYRPEATAGANGRAANLAVKAGLASFSRAQETEADLVGLDLLAKAGYNVHEAPVVHSIFARLSGRVGGGLAAMFETHPRSADRVETLKKAIEEKYSDIKYAQGTTDTDLYRKLVADYKQRKLKRLAEAQ